MGWQQVVGWTALALGAVDLAVLNLDVFPALAEQQRVEGAASTGTSRPAGPSSASGDPPEKLAMAAGGSPALPGEPAAGSGPGQALEDGREQPAGAADATALRAAAGDRPGKLDLRVGESEQVKNIPRTGAAADEPADGAVSEQLIGRVGFSFKAHRLHGGHRRQLKVWADDLLARPRQGGLLVVVGHTDRIGTDENNRVLGQRRAEAVADELKRLGIAASKMRVLSEGESKPRAHGPSLRDRRKNRRVEIYWQGSSR